MTESGLPPLIRRSRFERRPNQDGPGMTAVAGYGEFEERLLGETKFGFDNYDFAEATTLDRDRLDRVAGELVSTGGNAFIFGGAGSGKTHLSIALARQAARERKTVRYLDDRPDEPLTEPWFMATGPSAGPRVDIVTCDLLIVDEIAKRRPDAAATLGCILIERYRNKRSTVITTCRTPAEIIQSDLLPFPTLLPEDVLPDKDDWYHWLTRAWVNAPGREDAPCLGIWPFATLTAQLFLKLNIGVYIPRDGGLRELLVRDRVLLPPDIGAAAMYMALDFAQFDWIEKWDLLMKRFKLAPRQPERQWHLFYLNQRSYRDHPKNWLGRVEKSPNPAVTAAWLDELGGTNYKPDASK